MLKPFFPAWPSHTARGGGTGLQPPGNHDMTKENQGENKQCRYNTVLLTNWTEVKSLTEQKRKKKKLIQ